MNQTLRPHPDLLNYVITFICLLIANGMIVYGFLDSDGPHWVFIAIGISLLVLPLFFTASKYHKDGQMLSIRCLFRSLHICIDDYDIDFHATNFQLGGYLRTFASGGYWGYWGYWRRLSDGRRARSFLVNRSHEVAVLTPRSGKGDLLLLNVPKAWVEDWQAKGTKAANENLQSL